MHFGAWAALVFQNQVFCVSYPALSLGTHHCCQDPVSDHMLYFRCQTSMGEFLYVFALPGKEKKRKKKKKKEACEPVLGFQISQL